MDNAGPIMDKVKAELPEAYQLGTSMVRLDHITTFCDNLEHFFVLWDDAFGYPSGWSVRITA